MSDIAFKVLIGNGYDDVLFKTIMLKGEKGDQGEAGGALIDDTTTSTEKTWSSSKINSEISAKPSAFSQLSDVAIVNISDGQMAVYDFTTGKWKNQNVDASTLKYNSVKTIKDELDAKASSLTDLDDVNITNPQNAQGMIYDSTTGKWKNGNPAVSGDLDDLDDVQIDLNTLADGQAVKWDAQNNRWVNGTVSTIGNLDDLSDVDTTGKASGDSLRYDGAEWIAQPTTVALTQAEYDALQLSGDLAPNTHYVITDAPNLNPTASDIEYSGAVTVKQAIDSKADKTWEYIGKITNGDTGLDVSNKSEVLLVGFANNNTRYLSFVFPVAEIVGVATVIVIEGTGTNKYIGEIAVDSNYKITTTQYSISGWSSMYLKIYAR